MVQRCLQLSSLITLTVDTANTSETSSISTRLHGTTSQETVIFIINNDTFFFPCFYLHEHKLQVIFSVTIFMFGMPLYVYYRHLEITQLIILEILTYSRSILSMPPLAVPKVNGGKDIFNGLFIFRWRQFSNYFKICFCKRTICNYILSALHKHIYWSDNTCDYSRFT